MLKDYSKELNLRMEQIYNADESGLYWKMLPEKTYAASFEKSAPGRKLEKQRITFPACTNANGSQTIKPLAKNGIGKRLVPRGDLNYRNLRHKSDFNIPSYRSNIFHHIFTYNAVKVCDSLNGNYKKKGILAFKRAIKNHLLGFASQAG
ncbi:unnamed protein product [Acanthoscelides obtectus]|uniref:Uncharacterized protein n=1 Tax=Acanthoscelides obtectus TaxID=200917 RepID=A0A9P0LC20_ACAOB|nr:unnamed protein product [Acanthoscelides obtectus]CAK1629573.1 Jerky protein homolog-like [Acanthoscelides obtectus]